MLPKWFVTIHGADHIGPFTDLPSRYDTMIDQTTIDFWRGTLASDRPTLDQIERDATAGGLATVERG